MTDRMLGDDCIVIAICSKFQPFPNILQGIVLTGFIPASGPWMRTD